MNEQALQDRLREINARLRIELAIELANRPKDFSYQRQELLTEQNELNTQRRVTERAISDLAAPPAKPNPARERFIAAEVATRREGLVAWIKSLERSGDWRNARLYRQSMLELREQVEREFPP